MRSPGFFFFASFPCLPQVRFLKKCCESWGIPPISWTFFQKICHTKDHPFHPHARRRHIPVKQKRILAWVLTLVLLLGIFPLPMASAAQGDLHLPGKTYSTDYTTWRQAGPAWGQHCPGISTPWRAPAAW